MDQATSAIPMRLFPKGEAGSTNVEAKPHITHIKCLKPGGIVASIEDTKQGKAIFIENEDLLAWVRLRGALLFVIYKNAVTGRKKVLGEGRFEVGAGVHS